MILNTRVIFTTDEFIKNSIIKKFNFKKWDEVKFDLYTLQREIDDETENLVFVYFKKEFTIEVINFVKENYILFKIVIIWYSQIVRNQDLDAWDIILPNTFIDSSWNNPIFLDYAVWENYDLNKFWLILNWICMDKDCECSKCDIDNSNEISEEFVSDIIDCSTYKILTNLEKEDTEKTVVISICVNSKDDKNNTIFIDNLLNIVDVMI